MSIAVVMPQLGLTMEEGTLSAWLKKSGETVKKDELLFSVSTDKVEMDVESVADGVLGQILHAAGSTVPVGTVLAYIEGSKTDSTAPVVEVAATNPAGKSGALHHEAPAASTAVRSSDSGKAATGPAGARRKVSPRAKKLAKELGIDLAGVQGEIPDGEITEEDVLKASKREGSLNG